MISLIIFINNLARGPKYNVIYQHILRENVENKTFMVRNNNHNNIIYNKGIHTALNRIIMQDT